MEIQVILVKIKKIKKVLDNNYQLWYYIYRVENESQLNNKVN